MEKAVKLGLIGTTVCTIIVIILSFLASVFLPAPVQAQFYPEPGTPFINKSGAQEYFIPKPCTSGQGSKPTSERKGSYCPDLSKSDPNAKDIVKYACASEGYQQWLADPNLNFWVEDPDVTALGKGGERSRQFLLWTLTHNSIDSHPVINEVWQLSESVALFLVLIVVIIMGIGIILGQRNNFNLRIQVWPLVIRVAMLLLFIIFSSAIVHVIIQLADVMMEFFIRTLGVRELFNIFFVDAQNGTVIQASETAYREFIGCSNWNASNFEMVRTSKFLVQFTNMTYYFFGIMLILRKVVLWFLLIVSPFLAILAPFTFIRNTGWIWIGVFFQWIFYGPLMSLFLGALAKIWNNPDHIPFVFDFSRTHSMTEAVYPTSINILYGGPAQTLGIWNTSNYVDTFAEYVISLIMLWTVLILPWWLLRIFRDYCCDGIYAMKNILMSMYDQQRQGPGPKPGPTPTISPRPTSTAGLEMQIPQMNAARMRIQIPNIREIRTIKTEEIVKTVEMKASNIREIANIETNKVTRENVVRNINQIQNPMKAQNSEDRQKLTDLRDEIRRRASRGDQSAQRLNSVANSSQQQVAKQQILATMPKLVPVVQTIAVKFNMSKEKAQGIVGRVMSNVSANTELVGAISAQAQVPVEKTQQVLKAVSRADQMDKTPQQQVQQASMETGVEEAKVRAVIQQTAIVVKQKSEVTQQVAATEQVKQEVVQQVIQESLPAVSAPEQHVDQTIPSSSPKVSIEEYEQVKSMWTQQYEKGEVPVTENIKDRAEWVSGDTVRITNILNKVTSQNKQMQEQGLDEVGFILPIFMVNNLSGEELLVYLKAKLEAAKQVERDIEKEKSIREEVKSKEQEELVEIDLPKAQAAAKEQTLQAELKIDEPKDENGTGGTGGSGGAGSTGGATGGATGGMGGSANAVEGAVTDVNQAAPMNVNPEQHIQSPIEPVMPQQNYGVPDQSAQSDPALDEVKRKLAGDLASSD
jgi:uncharacterized membrane protein YgcG